MNENTLRGFCQKCEWPIEYLVEEGPVITWIPVHSEKEWSRENPEDCPNEGIVPVWFLSPKQIEIVYYSKEFLKYTYGTEWKGKGLPEIGTLKYFIQEEPFLVAKILKEAKT